jgi:hypothetical protein
MVCKRRPRFFTNSSRIRHISNEHNWKTTKSNLGRKRQGINKAPKLEAKSRNLPSHLDPRFRKPSPPGKNIRQQRRNLHFHGAPLPPNRRQKTPPKNP